MVDDISPQDLVTPARVRKPPRSEDKRPGALGLIIALAAPVICLPLVGLLVGDPDPKIRDDMRSALRANLCRDTRRSKRPDFLAANRPRIEKESKFNSRSGGGRC
jgi:hypothetical protein